MITFSMIVAVSLNGVIGDSKSNTMPWHLPEDLNHFKRVTTGGVVVMGSKTFDSIGRLLPHRRNIVITKDKPKAFNYRHVLGVHDVYESLDDIMLQELPGFFVIGGGKVYAEALKLKPDTIYATIVFSQVEGDVYFPITGEDLLADSTHGYTCISRSDIKEHNGTKYQFAKFRLDDSALS